MANTGNTPNFSAFTRDPSQPQGPGTPPQKEADASGLRELADGAPIAEAPGSVSQQPSLAAINTEGGPPAGGGANSPATQAKAPAVGSGRIRAGDPYSDRDAR